MQARFDDEHAAMPGIAISVFATMFMWAIAAAPCAAITLGMVDDFQDGEIAGWFGAGPTNAADSGPGGIGDNALSVQTTGGVGSGSRLVVLNREQWLGDYTAAGVTRLSMDIRNPNATFDLSMRLAIAGPGGHLGLGGGETFSLTVPIIVPADDAWHTITFDFNPEDFTAVSGTDPVAAVANVTELRLMHNWLAGDYNDNNRVDALDYPLWRDTLGSTENLAADGNANDEIDPGDYGIWKADYFDPSLWFGDNINGGFLVDNITALGPAGQAAGVPEPGTFLLLTFGLLSGCLRRTRRE